MEVKKELERIEVDQNEARRRRKCRLAVNQAVIRGVLNMANPVLDVGCLNPYRGIYAALRQDILWNGQYIGIDGAFDAKTVKAFDGHRDNLANHDVMLKAVDLNLEEGATLPFPPVEIHPKKMIGAAFLVGTLGRSDITEKRALVDDCKRIAAQVVIMGGVDYAELDRMEFPIQFSHTIDGEPETCGIWLDEAAKKVRQRRDAIPDTVIGQFAATNARTLGQRLGVCQKCGTPDPTARSKFECAKCGEITTVRRKA